MLSPDPQLDLLALEKELEQEEGLTPEEVRQGRERDTQGARGPHGRGTPGDPGDRGTQMTQGSQRREGSPVEQGTQGTLRKTRAQRDPSEQGRGRAPEQEGHIALSIPPLPGTPGMGKGPFWGGCSAG